MITWSLLLKVSSRAFCMAVMSFAFFAFSSAFAEVFANANKTCEKVLFVTNAYNEFKNRQSITDLNDLDPVFALDLREKIEIFSEMTSDQKRRFVEERWTNEGLSQEDISELLSSPTQTNIDEAFMDAVQDEIYEMYLQSLKQMAVRVPNLKRSEQAPPDQSTRRPDPIIKSEVRPNEVYDVQITNRLNNLSELRIRFSPQAIEDLNSENENDGNLLTALRRGFASSGMGIQPMTEAQVFWKNAPNPPAPLPVYRVKPKGSSSFRWVMTRLPNGDFFILGRLHKDKMQQLRIELDSKQFSNLGR